MALGCGLLLLLLLQQVWMQVVVTSYGAMVSGEVCQPVVVGGGSWYAWTTPNAAMHAVLAAPVH
jgi:hypothetical protein